MTAPVCRGFSLVEVLVAITVLAIGMLGTAGLQLAALQTARQSATRDDAWQLASDIAEQLRPYAADPALVTAASLDDFSHEASAGAGEPPAPDCHGSHCDRHQLLLASLYAWKLRLQTSLPHGRLRICRDLRPWDSVAASLRWECVAPASGEAPLVVKIGWPAPGGSRAAGPQLALATGAVLP